MMPSLAVPLVPSITARQLGPVILSWAWLRLPITTPVVAWYEVRFTCQGRSVAVRVNGSPIGPLQWVKLPEVTEPIPVPDSPPPCLSVPLTCEDAQVSTVPVLVSRTASRPDVKETEPPGRTVQVTAARTVVTPKTATMAAARAATRGRAYRVLIRCLLPEPGSEPGTGSLRGGVIGSGHGPAPWLRSGQVVPPGVLRHETECPLCPAGRQQRLELAHVPGERHAREDLLEQPGRGAVHHRIGGGDDVARAAVGGRLQGQPAGRRRVPLVDVAPQVPPARPRIGPVRGEQLIVGRAEDVGEPQADEGHAGPPGDLCGDGLACDLGQRIGRCRERVVVFVYR